jgi:arylsulfatase A-like enzyme
MLTPCSDAEDIGNRMPGSHFGTYYWTGPGQKVLDNLQGDDSRIIMDRVIPFIQNCARNDQNFLSVIWFHAPHLPVIADRDYRKMYGQYSEDIQHYYGCITAMDEQIGRLLDELARLGKNSNTIIFFTSDNGPEGHFRQGRKQGSTNGLKGRKRSLYEGGIRVPGIMTWPGKIKKPVVIHSPVSTSDFYPTILDILDITTSGQPKLDGISLIPLILGDRNKRPAPIGFQHHSQVAMIDNQFKIYSSDRGESYQLFDIVHDPSESTDLSLEFPEIKDTLINKLEIWIKSCKNSNEGHDYNK